MLSNQNNIDKLTLHLKRDGFPVQQIYRILPNKNQCFDYVLEDLEIPQNRIDFYTNSLQQGEYLLVINSTESQIKQIQAILEFLNMVDWEIYYTPRAYQVNSSKFDDFTLFDDSIYSMILN
ncbi:hypothetical protein IQ247_14590 [Plectonema cf. radiosum LEGE 06105]|uniref:Uncharacterized protein n=1 Tax=Plectonema cf. radiosum LEGE 06105 TaxID=945769 RepID=A0A8J7FCT4_9CYAN|nr:hypothetical protein [Plectonema radiosum]MBE9213878.1 hypothetical protein [Plectonema cf. radiosum LEGE 06105]